MYFLDCLVLRLESIFNSFLPVFCFLLLAADGQDVEMDGGYDDYGGGGGGNDGNFAADEPAYVPTVTCVVVLLGASKSRRSCVNYSRRI